MLFDGRIISGITVFVSVAKAGSYSRAAEHVGLSRSGVGKAIARLEERIGRRLFDRSSRHLKLTDDGRAFLDEVAPLLEQLGDAALPSEPIEVRGRIRVSCDAAFGSFLLMPVLSELVQLHPRLKIDLLIRDRADNLLAEGVDVAVRFGEPDPRGLEKTLILESRVVTCASSTYVSRHGMPGKPEDLLHGHNCVRLIDDVTGKPHNWKFVRADGETREIVPDCNVVVNDAPAVLAGALTDFGVVRALDFMVEDHLKNGRIVEILPEWNNVLWPAYIYSPVDTYSSHGLKAFKTFVKASKFNRAPHFCKGLGTD